MPYRIDIVKVGNDGKRMTVSAKEYPSRAVATFNLRPYSGAYITRNWERRIYTVHLK